MFFSTGNVPLIVNYSIKLSKEKKFSRYTYVYIASKWILFLLKSFLIIIYISTFKKMQKIWTFLNILFLNTFSLFYIWQCHSINGKINQYSSTHNIKPRLLERNVAWRIDRPYYRCDIHVHAYIFLVYNFMLNALRYTFMWMLFA